MHNVYTLSYDGSSYHIFRDTRAAQKKNRKHVTFAALNRSSNDENPYQDADQPVLRPDAWLLNPYLLHSERANPGFVMANIKIVSRHASRGFAAAGRSIALRGKEVRPEKIRSAQ
jgi:hypothetical protein